jgi:1,4-alpha-glucan branching enzyme
MFSTTTVPASAGSWWTITVTAYMPIAAMAAPCTATVVVAANFTPVPRLHYRFGVPRRGAWREILNTDAEIYGGSNLGNGGWVQANAQGSHGQPVSLELTLPPLATVLLRHDG